MYYILGVKCGDVYSMFMDAFNVQQDKYSDRKIIYSKDNILQIVWDPKWEEINCNDLC